MTAQRSDGQKIGSKGQRLVLHLIENCGGWIARGLEEDFGIDAEAELDEPEVKGQIVKIQIKSSESVKIIDDFVRVGVEKKYFELARNFRYPLIFVVADVTSQKAWYAWLQEWLIRQRRNNKKFEDLAEKTTINIPITDELCVGLKDRIKSIARWEEETQLLLALLDTTRTAINTTNNEVLQSLTEVIEGVDKTFENFPIESLIEKIVEMSKQTRAFSEFGLLSFLLGTLFRKYGDRVSLNDILLIVLRDNTYSRTGIRLLGILYDYFPDHVAKFNLASIFDKPRLERLVYYCKLREKYHGTKASTLISGDYDYRVGEITLDFVDDKGWLMNKWANRGDSIFVDYSISKKID